MSNDKDDLTRIEDLSEFLHEDDDAEQFESSEDDSSEDDTSVDFDLNNDATDPNIEFPEEFRPEGEAQIEEDSFETEETTDFSDGDDFDSAIDNDSDFSDGEDFTPAIDDDSDFSDDNSFDTDNTNFSSDGDEEFNSVDDFSDDEEEQEIKTSPNEEEPLEATAQFETDEIVDVMEEPEQETIPEKTEEITPAEELAARSEVHKDEYKAPENFKELREFANTINFANTEHEGNPPFSIVISELKYNEDLEDILILLSEFGVTKDDTQRNAYKESLKRGSALIPRLSEYAAITLCHKLRRFDINLKMGLTESINPPKSYTSNDKGLTSKQSLYNSKSVHFEFSKDELTPKDIQLSTMNTITGFEILHQAGITNIQTTIDTNATSGEVLNVFELDSAMNELKQRAIKEKVNAVIGIQYQILHSDKDQQTIIITGNLVWLKRF